jgi:electron transfer flavoprotein beta subunit
VASATFAEGRIVATRRTGDQEQTFSLPVPVVLGVAAESDVDKAPGMKEMLAARKRPLTKLTLTELGIHPGQALVSRGTERPDVEAARVFTGVPAATAAQLVSALRAEGVL